MSDRRISTRRVAADAVFLILALALSYIEAMVPLGAVIPLPGFKPGLANILITLLVFRARVIDGAIVSLLRILIMGLLFGTPISLFLSAGGAMLSFFALLLLHQTAGRHLSFVGVSVLSAAAHNIGQLICVGCIFGLRAAAAYLPLLLVASVLFGALSGALLNVLYPRLERVKWERIS